MTPDGPLSEHEQAQRRLRLLVYQTRVWIARMESAYPEPTPAQRMRLVRARIYLVRLTTILKEEPYEPEDVT